MSKVIKIKDFLKKRKEKEQREEIKMAGVEPWFPLAGFKRGTIEPLSLHHMDVLGMKVIVNEKDKEE